MEAKSCPPMFRKCAHFTNRTMDSTFANALLLTFTLGFQVAIAGSDSPGMVLIAQGSYTPLYKEAGVAKQVEVVPFYIDKFQVSNQEFVEFIDDNAQWQKQNISPIFADQGYLSQLKAGSLDQLGNQPVTNVSWYASMAYCRAAGKTLPSTDQWEYAAQASSMSPVGIEQPEFKRKILDWYARPAAEQLPDVQTGEVNYWGVHGMHGVVWEQVSDFNNALITGESRNDSALDKKLFCGSGAALAVDPGDYAAFMRYALRGSYSAHYTLSSMGFRCAKNS